MDKINITLDGIVQRLNALAQEEQDAGQYGVSDINIALDIRADNWDGEGDCPPPTPDELSAIQAECDANLAKFERIDAEKTELYERYHELTGTTPHMYDNGFYARSRHEKILF